MVPYKNKNSSILTKPNKGFTLAEVLITLGIVGAIASMTIPNLIQNYQDNQLKTSAKTAYSKLSQSVSQLRNDEGGALPNYSGNALKLALIKYFKIIKDCGNNNCVPGSASSTIYKNLLGSGAYAYLIDDGQFIISDGSIVFPSDNNITVDINGYKRPPNIFGKDVFMFQIVKDKLLPMGDPSTSFSVSNGYCDKNDAQSRGSFQGFGCMYYVIQGIDY